MRSSWPFPVLVAVLGLFCGQTQAANEKGGAAEVYAAWPFDAKEATRRQDETAKALGVPKETTIDLGGAALKFVLIPAGKFKDDAGKEVTIDKPFYMGQFKVTQPQYSLVMGKNPSKHINDNNPVDTVKWADATEFCKKASEKTKKHISLPTSVQRESACRAGTATRCYWGDDMKNMGDYCWWHDNCEGTTHPVGQKKPNAFGLYDMMGLLFEWCSDGGAGAATHPIRGATFGSKEPMFKSSQRGSESDNPTGFAINDRYGMRVVMDID